MGYLYKIESANYKPITMKFSIYLFLILAFCACTNTKDEVIEEVTNNNYVDITEDFSIEDFELAKAFILNNGDRQTYRAFDSNNPHYSFEGFEAYLNAEIGQKNITNDPAISGFNEITIRDKNANPQYYTIHVVRIGDTSKKDITIHEGMREGRVYLLNPFENDLEVMKNNLNGYLQTIKSDKEQETGKPNIPVNDTIDVNSDKMPDFVISYRELKTADQPSSGGSIIGSITPMQQNQLLYRANVGSLFLNINDVIRKTNNTNTHWLGFRSDLITIHRNFQNWDSTWTILAEQKPFYFLAYKLITQNSEEIGWICLKFDTEKGTISITDSDRTSNDELMINKKTTF